MPLACLESIVTGIATESSGGGHYVGSFYQDEQFEPVARQTVGGYDGNTTKNCGYAMKVLNKNPFGRDTNICRSYQLAQVVRIVHIILRSHNFANNNNARFTL